jgi:hypothetical protein
MLDHNTAVTRPDASPSSLWLCPRSGARPWGAWRSSSRRSCTERAATRRLSHPQRAVVGILGSLDGAESTRRPGRGHPTRARRGFYLFLAEPRLVGCWPRVVTPAHPPLHLAPARLLPLRCPGGPLPGPRPGGGHPDRRRAGRGPGGEPQRVDPGRDGRPAHHRLAPPRRAARLGSRPQPLRPLGAPAACAGAAARAERLPALPGPLRSCPRRWCSPTRPCPARPRRPPPTRGARSCPPTISPPRRSAARAPPRQAGPAPAARPRKARLQPGVALAVGHGLRGGDPWPWPGLLLQYRGLPLDAARAGLTGPALAVQLFR